MYVCILNIYIYICETINSDAATNLQMQKRANDDILYHSISTPISSYLPSYPIL